jgi:hypothetical protein
MITREKLTLAISAMNTQIEKLTVQKLEQLRTELGNLTVSELFTLRNAVARFQASEQIDLEVALWGHRIAQHWETSPVADKVVLLEVMRALAGKR